MKSNKIRLGEQCVVTSSKRFHLSERITQGVPFYCSKEIIKKFNGEDVTECDYISEDLYKKVSNEFGVPKENDLLITTRGTIGIPYLYKRTDRFYFADGNLTWIKDFDSNLYSKFLYYWFQSYEGRKKFEALAKGTAQKAVPISGIKTLEIELPSLKSQKRIADILSAYDDLIENNQKQIKLLEEAAQRLYKEWFVDLHFPGHENTKIVDGVPEGWQWCKVRDVADINSSALPKNYKEDFIDYVDLGSVRCGHIETRTRYNLNEAPGRAKRCARDGDIIWGMVRPNLKAYALVTNPKETDVFSTGFAVLSAKKVPYSYLYCAVTQEEFVGYLVNATNGAAYPAVKPVHFEVADILKPDDKVLEQFHSVADSIYRKKEALENQNHNLSEARDLLLPKLMNGEVEV